MKMTWKNQSKNITKKRPLSCFQNLPFEQQEDDTNNNNNNKNLQKEEVEGNDVVSRNTLVSDENIDEKKLAQVYEEQGNHLAELLRSCLNSEARCDICTFSRNEASERIWLRCGLDLQDGKFREALGKWEAALTLMPERAVLHEQKAQVLLELGEAWSALKAATRVTELEPTWAEAWITLGRAQLNFGEPDSAIESFDRALGIKPDSVDARDDRKTALHLIKRRKQLHSSGLSANMNRFAVGENVDLP